MAVHAVPPALAHESRVIVAQLEQALGKRALVAPEPQHAPDQHERPTGREHAVHLGGGAFGVEPVPRVADHHGIHRAVVQRDRLGAALERPGELPAHGGGGLHRDHLETRVPQRRGEQARARGEVEDAGRAWQLQRFDHLRGVGRPAAVVDGRGRALEAPHVAVHG